MRWFYNPVIILLIFSHTGIGLKTVSKSF